MQSLIQTNAPAYVLWELAIVLIVPGLLLGVVTIVELSLIVPTLMQYVNKLLNRREDR